MALRSALVLVLLACLACSAASARAQATRTTVSRTWSVSPADDVQPGDLLTFKGTGCAKRGTSANHLEIVIDTNFGLLGYVPVKADGTWQLVSRVSPSPGQFLMILHASCFDDRGQMASAGAKLVFTYSQVLVVRYAGGVIVSVPPLRALEDKPLNREQVAFFTYPTAAGVATPPSQFTATVNWDDGVVSTEDVITAPAGITRALPGQAAYEVVGTHTYRAPRSGQVTVTVRLKGAKTRTAGSAKLIVDPVHPRAAFDVNPTNPQKYGIALLMPTEGEPWQREITQWRWGFPDEDYNAVSDSDYTHPKIAQAVNALIDNPGDSDARKEGVRWGILPRSVTALIGSLSDGDIRQLATVWREYWPRHIVPHLFMAIGHPRITLEIVDSGPDPSTSPTYHDLNVTPDCRPWGGYLKKYFGGYTTCHTYQGIATQFGEHRVADYVSIGASKQAISLNKLAGGGGPAIVITRGVYENPAASVFLTMHLEEGVGVGLPYGGGVTQGWLGPPDPAHTPSDYAAVNSFVGGPTISAGFNLGLFGWHGIESPNSGAVGEELFVGIAGVSADAGIACSWPLPELGNVAASTLRGVLRDTGNPNDKPSGSQIEKAERLVAAAVGRAKVDLVLAGVNAMLSCV